LTRKQDAGTYSLTAGKSENAPRVHIQKILKIFADIVV
jgi:hypothetical protein